MKQVEAKILHQTFHLSCPEGEEERLQSAVHKVNEAMISIRDKGKTRTRENIAILAAVNVTFDLLKAPSKPEPSTMDTAEQDHWQVLLSRLDTALASEDPLSIQD